MVELRPVIEDVLVALLAEGNVLLEGVPGIGKTYLVRTLGQVLRLQFRRVQFRRSSRSPTVRRSAACSGWCARCR